MKTNKKSQTGLLLWPTIAFIAALIFFFAFKAPTIEDYIGGKQAAVLRVVGLGEQTLSFIDTSAKLASWEAILDLGENGGFYSDIGDDSQRAPQEFPCDKFGYNLWSSKSNKCWPTKQVINESFSYYFNNNIKLNFFSQDPQNRFNQIDYDISVENELGKSKTIIRGLSSDKIPIKIVYEQQQEEEKVVTSDKMPAYSEEQNILPVAAAGAGATTELGGEPITKCCDGNCVVRIAEQYNKKYGADGNIKLPYVWGGASPYPIEESINDKNKNGVKSFFYGASLYLVQPAGNPKRSGKPTPPGFDCSGFVWWVYKHAGMPQFINSWQKNAILLQQYGKGQIAKGVPGYAEICSYQSCVQGVFESNNDVNKALPGDLIFLYKTKSSSDVGHVAIYVGNGQIIDSSGDRNGIAKRGIPQSWYGRMAVYRFAYNAGCEAVSAEASAIEAGSAEVSETSTDISTSSSANTVTEANFGSSASSLSNDPLSPSEKKAIEKINNDYSDLISQAVEKYKGNGNGLTSELLKAVIMQESAGDPNAGSRSGCQGLMQFCGGTAYDYGLCDNKACSNRDDRTNPEKAIPAAAKYMDSLLARFKKYDHKDAFALASYNAGEALIRDAISQTGKSDDSTLTWNEVTNYVNAKLIYKHLCEKAHYTYFCNKNDGPVNCQNKVPEIIGGYLSNGLQLRGYVNGIMRYIAAFGGGSISFTSDYKGTTVSFTEKDLGYYYVNPSFKAEVDYDLGVYDQITAWARLVYERCTGYQGKLADCVNEEVKKQNSAFVNILSLSQGNIIPGTQFLFFIANNSDCDGADYDYYRFIETFENCLEFGNSQCYCSFPKSLSFYKINLSAKHMVLFDANGPKSNRFYDFTENKKFTLYHDGEQKDSLLIEKRSSMAMSVSKNNFLVKYSEESQPASERVTENLYFVNNNGKLDDFVSLEEYAKMQSCALPEKQHKFRFCVATPQEIHHYNAEDEELVLDNVRIKFALDLYDAPPPAITSDSIEVSKPKDDAGPEKAVENLLTKEKKCEGLENAKFDLKVTTGSLVPDYESFLSSFTSKLAPQLTMLLFAKNFLVQKETLPAMVTVSLDLKGASNECDITGMAYKCGLGIVPKKADGTFDFSNPTGYVDISPRFNSNSGVSVAPPGTCTAFKNPDGKPTENLIPLTAPTISGDLISFSVTKCTDPITQFKKMKGIDLLVSALQGFNYYFAFSYVDAAGNYGPATLKAVEIPSVLSQLQAELGISDFFMIKDLLMGNYDSLLAKLGLDDELRMVRSAIASASLDRLLANIKGEVLNKAYAEIAKNIKDEDAQKIFSQLADYARDGRLDDVSLLVDKAKELIPENVDDFIDNIDYDELRNSYDYVKDLPAEKKRELLERYYTEKAKAQSLAEKQLNDAKQKAEDVKNLGDQEVDKQLKKAMQAKENAVIVLKLLDPADKIEAAKQIMSDSPQLALDALDKTLGADAKVQLVKEVLQEATDTQSDLARIIAQATPDYAKKAALDWITSQPGYEGYKDVLNIFTDFENTCQ